MEILLKVKSGEKIPYIEQVKGLYDITPQYPSDSINTINQYKNVRSRYEKPSSKYSSLTYDRTNANTIHKLYYYQKTLNSFYRFMVSEGLDFVSPTVKGVGLIEARANKDELIMNQYDLQYWKEGVDKSYVNVFQITRFLGVDPYTFRINPSNSPFDPHHFRAFAFRKMSTHTQDLIVTSKRFHPKYEALKGRYGRRAAEVYVETLINSLDELMGLRDSLGNIRKIQDSDVITVLKKGFGSEWKNVYDGWVSEFTSGMSGIDNYKDALDKINENRLEYLPGNIKGYTLEDFLKKEYMTIYINNYYKYLRGSILI